MWKNIRIFALLLVLLVVALQAWRDQIQTQSWREPLWVGIFPLNGDGTPQAQRYVEALTVKDFADIEAFFAREAHRYGLAIEQPVHIELYPPGSQLPPALPADAGPAAIVWWSLKLRWFAAHASKVPGRVPARIRMFVLPPDAKGSGLGKDQLRQPARVFGLA